MIKRNTLNRRMVKYNVTDYIKNTIKKNRMKHGDPMQSPRQLSKLIDIPEITINRAINKLVKDNILYRVKGSGTFVAGTEKGLKTYTIGIGLEIPVGETSIVDAAFRSFYTPAVELLRKEKHEIIYLEKADMQNPDIAADILKKVDGLIISFNFIDPKTIPNFKKAGKTVVVVQHEEIKDLPFHQVIPDLYPGSKDMITFLSEKIRTEDELILLQGDGGHAANRSRVFLQALANSNLSHLPVKKYEIKSVVGDLGRQASYVFGMNFLKKQKKRLFIVSMSDFLSFGLLDAISEKGLSYGKDVFIASYDNLESHGVLPSVTPLLSSIDINRDQISLAAANLITTLLGQEKTGNIHIIKTPTNFISR